MKKLVSLILAISLVLLTGCAQNAPVSESTSATEALPDKHTSQAVTVSTVDEFLAALGSDKEITLAPGTYDLTTAADYGLPASNPAYIWQEAMDGYELSIVNAENLTIRGSGKDQTTILTQPRYANVMVLSQCENVQLEDFTAGHTETGQMCNGGVIHLTDTNRVTIDHTGLYGCGTIGVDAWNCTELLVSNCDIYDCSFGGIYLSDSRDCAVENTSLHNIGGTEEYTGSLFQLFNCSDINIRSCTAKDNSVYHLLDFSISNNVRLEGCTFQNNHVIDSGFQFHEAEPVLVENTFENTSLRKWYSGNSPLAVDAQGKPLDEHAFPAREMPAVSTEPQKQVKVSTVDELLAAIAPNTEIILEAEQYDLSSAKDYGTGNTDYYRWEPCEDGNELIIHDVNNLTITSSDGRRTDHNILAAPRYANVLRFVHCQNSTISGFTAGHTQGPGYCTSGVVSYEDCDNMTVDNCGLFGCGTIGVSTQNCAGIQVLNSDIYECASRGVCFESTDSVTVENTSFHHIGTSEEPADCPFYLYSCKDVVFRNCTVNDNCLYAFANFFVSKNIRLEHNTFRNNALKNSGLDFQETEVILDGNTFQDNMVRTWYQNGSLYAKDASGHIMDEGAFPAMERPAAISAPQKQVKAATVDEFLAAIAPNTKIFLEAELYDLSAAKDYGTGSTDYYCWQECFDGFELVIQNVSNLTITTSGGDHKAHTISAIPRYANVLRFENCQSCTVSGFTAGHTKEPGSCVGGVIYCDNCDNMTVDNCGLFGCGILGVETNNCTGIRVLNSEIYECSYGGIQLHSTSDVTIENTTFRDLGGDDLILHNSKNVTLDGKPYPA